MRPFLYILISAFAGAFLAVLITRSLWKPDVPKEIPGRHLAHAAAMGKSAVVWIMEKDASGNIDTTSSGAGSGVIISPDGYIVTNYHVVRNNDNSHVTLSNGREYIATFIGADTTMDVAVIRIQETGLPYLEFGNSDSTVLGEQVIAVGNPHRMAFTVTAGIISAKERPAYVPGCRAPYFIQTDVPINNGNSGGPLLNVTGDIIGLNVGIVTMGGGYEGLSLSIPGNMVHKIASELRTIGESRKGSLAIRIRNVNQDDANAARMPTYEGVVIDAIEAGSSADTAGLRSLDIITSFNGIKVVGKNDFLEKLELTKPGDLVTFGVNRGGEVMEVAVVMEGKN